MIGSYPFDLPPYVVAGASEDLVKLYRERRCLAAARADITVKRARTLLAKLASEENLERAVHAAIKDGTVIPFLPKHCAWGPDLTNVEREPVVGTAKIFPFPRTAKERAAW